MGVLVRSAAAEADTTFRDLIAVLLKIYAISPPHLASLLVLAEAALTQLQQASQRL